MSNWEMKDYAQLPADHVQEDKEAARKQLEIDTQKFFDDGGEITSLEAERVNEISPKIKEQLKKSLAYYEDRNLTKSQKEKRRLKKENQ